MGYVGRGSSTQVLTENSSSSLPNFKDITFPSSKTSFLVHLNTTISNVTGSGTLYSILFDTIDFDTGSNITLNSGGHTIFTAPVTGVYLFHFGLCFSNAASSGNNGSTSYITVNGNIYTCPTMELVNVANSSHQFGCLNSIVAQMSASQVTYVQALSNDQMSNTVGILGSASAGGNIVTYFCGSLLS